MKWIRTYEKFAGQPVTPPATPAKKDQLKQPFIDTKKDISKIAPEKEVTVDSNGVYRILNWKVY